MTRITLSLFSVVVLGASCMARAGLVSGGGEPAATPPTTTSDRSSEAPASTSRKVFPNGDWSLAERSSWKRIYAQTEQDTNLMNSSCGTEITFGFDHEAFRDRLAATDKNINEDWNVSAMISEVRNVCLDGDDEKAVVASSIRSIQFVRASASNQLSDGALQVSLDLEANPRAHVNSFAGWLRSAL